MSVSEILQIIRAKGDWLQADAKRLAESVKELPYQRDFYTEAEDAMLLAERDLEDALHSVRASRRAFQAKPKEISHA